MFEWQRSLFDQAANKSCGGALSNDSPRRLGFPAPRREDVFGIAVRLLASLEDQIASCLESHAVEAGRHRTVQRVALVLASTTTAIRFSDSITCSLVMTPWCSQLAR